MNFEIHLFIHLLYPLTPIQGHGGLQEPAGAAAQNHCATVSSRNFEKLIMSQMSLYVLLGVKMCLKKVTMNLCEGFKLRQTCRNFLQTIASDTDSNFRTTTVIGLVISHSKRCLNMCHLLFCVYFCFARSHFFHFFANLSR